MLQLQTRLVRQITSTATSATIPDASAQVEKLSGATSQQNHVVFTRMYHKPHKMENRNFLVSPEQYRVNAEHEVADASELIEAAPLKLCLVLLRRGRSDDVPLVDHTACLSRGWLSEALHTLNW